MTVEYSYENLPEDDDLAFVYIEDKFQKELDISLRHEQNVGSHDIAYIRYMTQAIAAGAYFGIADISNFEIPSYKESSGNIFCAYQDFVTIVNHFKVQVLIHSSRGKKRYSVALDVPTKQKIRQYLKKIREMVDAANLDASKKEKIYEKVSELEEEVNRDRSRFEVVADFILKTASTLGDTAEKLDPIRKIIDSISNAISKAKEAEDIPRSIGRSEYKKLKPPHKNQIEKSNRNIDDTDDEIPF